MDTDKKRCTIRVTEKVNLKAIIYKIKDMCGLTAFIVSKTTRGGEVRKTYFN